MENQENTKKLEKDDSKKKTEKKKEASRKIKSS